MVMARGGWLVNCDWRESRIADSVSPGPRPSASLIAADRGELACGVQPPGYLYDAPPS